MSLLRKSLIANGVFSTVTGTATVAFASGLGAYLLVSRTALNVIGVGVALFGLTILWESRSPSVGRGFALFVIVADLSWVLAAIVVFAVPGSMANKWVLATVTLVVAGFVVLQSRGLVEESTRAPRRIVTRVEIGVPTEVVWDRLTDLEGFAEWNPFMIEATGVIETGQTLGVRMRQPGGSDMSFRPEVTVVDRGEQFEWLGHLFVPGLFDGRHRFELTSTPAGTHLTHSEEFSGVLVPLLWRSLDTKTRSGFEAMNQALKTSVEDSVRDSA